MLGRYSDALPSVCGDRAPRYGPRVSRGLGLYALMHLLVCGGLACRVHAQESGGATTAAADDGGEAGTGDDRAVVFIAPAGLAPDLTSALEEAVAAQVSLVGGELVFLEAGTGDAGLEERMSQAEALAHEHHAVGAFWIDARPSKRWFMYIMDRTGAHVVVRPLSVGENVSLDAAIEAAAVIAGSATDALLKREPIEGELTPKHKAPLTEEALALELGYSGTMFAPRVPWVNGMWIGAAWRWPAGSYMGVSYVWSPPLSIAEKSEVTFELARYPVWLQGGVRLSPFRRFDIAGELALGIEVRTRTTTSQIYQLEQRPSSTRATYLASVRLVGEYRLNEWLAIVLRVSPEVSFNSFDYKKFPDPKSGKAEVTYLSPYLLRFTAQLGLAIIR